MSTGHPASAGAALPWIAVVLLAAAVAVGAAFAPLQVSVGGACLSLALLTISRLGFLAGAWYILLFTLPLREPLGYDILGTRTLYASDVILHLLTFVVLVRHGIIGLWHDSATLKIGVGILALSMIGLYITNDASAIVAIHRMVGQIAIFFLARHFVRNSTDATRTIVWFLAGLAPAILYGLYQASLPLEGTSYQDWAKVPITYDEFGTPHMRAFSTFDHTLHFSQALSMGFGLAAGLLFSTRSAALRLFCVVTAAAAGLCNQVTYSVSGIIGTAAATVTVVLGQRRRWLMLALPALLLVAILAAPSALFERINHLLTGRSISTVVRMVTYRAGIQSFIEHPVFGIGWSGIPALKENFITDKSLPPAPENFFLHRAVAIGAPGLLLFVALVIVFARNWRRSAGLDPSWPRLAVLAGFIAYFSQAMFFPGENYANNYFLWVLLALAECMSRARRTEAAPDS